MRFTVSISKAHFVDFTYLQVIYALLRLKNPVSVKKLEKAMRHVVCRETLDKRLLQLEKEDLVILDREEKFYLIYFKSDNYNLEVFEEYLKGRFYSHEQGKFIAQFRKHVSDRALWHKDQLIWLYEFLEAFGFVKKE